MRLRDPGVFLEDIEHYAAAAVRFTKFAPAVGETIPHARDVIGFRNILAHGYAELDHAKVFEIAIVHAPALLLAAQEALKQYPAPR